MWTWLAANPGNYGSPEDFPTLAQWLDRYVPSFTDFLGLIIDDELVAVGLLDEESYIHCLINPKCTKPFTRARLLKYSVLPYFAAKYRFLYTEIISRNKKAEKLVKYLGFEILPQSYTHPNRKVAIYRKK